MRIVDQSPLTMHYLPCWAVCNIHYHYCPFLSGNCRMVGPHNSGIPYTKTLGAISSSSSSSDEQVSSDFSSDDDSKLQSLQAIVWYLLTPIVF